MIVALIGSTKAFEPHSINHGTYKFGKRRLDWVLLSSELEFKRYEVLPDIVSDHHAIVVEVEHTGSNQRDVDSENSTSENCSNFD